MNIKPVLLALSTVLVIGGFKPYEGSKPVTGPQHMAPAAASPSNLNISILLDLSDRISPTKYPNPGMAYYKRDLGYIQSIVKGFQHHLRSKPIVRMNDQIQVYFEPEPLNERINTLANTAKISFNKANITKQAIDRIPMQYNSASQEIYNLALKDKNYIGADIWGFFKNKVNDYCIKPNHRNILFILTDGYTFYKDSKFMQGPKSSYLTPELIRALKLNTASYQSSIDTKGYGFIKANNNLGELEVVVLGINAAKGNPYERDVLEAYWGNWLKEMKVKKYMIKAAELPSNLDPLIQHYLQ